MTSDYVLDPVVNPDAQEALSVKYANLCVILIPLSSGRFAIFDRSFELHDIVDPGDLPSADDLRTMSVDFQTNLFYKSKLSDEARFFGEPDAKQLARDLKTTRTEDTRKPKPKPPTIDVDY